MGDTTEPDESADEAESDGDASTGAVEIPCSWFFLPLPHPLGLPDKWLSQRVLTPIELLGASRPTSGLSSSLLLHQLEPSTDRMLADTADLWLFGAATMTESAPPSGAEAVKEFTREAGVDTTPLSSVRTVAEVAVPGFSGEDEEEVLRALDIAIEHVRFIQRIVAGATQSAVRLLARATLPPTVPTFFGLLPTEVVGSAEPPKPRVGGSLDYFIPGCAPPTALGIRPEPFDAPTMDRVAHFADYVARSGGFDTYLDLRREAMVQRHFDGNNRMALVALATAGEVLLDTVLLHMLWEEHLPPEDAAAFFDRNKGHTARVGKHFPPRIGGGWDPQANSAAGRYLRELVRLRHQVVHAGHEPTDGELEAARTALSISRST